jgi:ABC-type multidrug transport system fused ATPase/permease subunit
MKSVLKFLLPYWALLILAVGMLFIQANCDSPSQTICRGSSISAFSAVALTARAGLTGRRRPAGVQMNYLVRVGGLMLLITSSGPRRLSSSDLFGESRFGFRARFARGVFKRVESFSNRELDKFSTASLITRTTNDSCSCRCS